MNRDVQSPSLFFRPVAMSLKRGAGLDESFDRNRTVVVLPVKNHVPCAGHELSPSRHVAVRVHASAHDQRVTGCCRHVCIHSRSALRESVGGLCRRRTTRGMARRPDPDSVWSVDYPLMPFRRDTACAATQENARSGTAGPSAAWCDSACEETSPPRHDPACRSPATSTRPPCE